MQTFIKTIAGFAVIAVSLIVNAIPTVFYIYGALAFRHYLNQ